MGISSGTERDPAVLASRFGLRAMVESLPNPCRDGHLAARERHATAARVFECASQPTEPHQL